MIQGGGWVMQRRHPRLSAKSFRVESRRMEEDQSQWRQRGENRRRVEDLQGNQRSLETQFPKVSAIRKQKPFLLVLSFLPKSYCLAVA